jgi:hypothetical protein
MTGMAGIAGMAEKRGMQMRRHVPLCELSMRHECGVTAAPMLKRKHAAEMLYGYAFE